MRLYIGIKPYNFELVKFLFILFMITCYGQEPTAIMELESNTQGVLLPRISTQDRLAIVNPAQSLMVYDTNTASYWYYKNTSWSEIVNNRTIASGSKIAGDSISNLLPPVLSEIQITSQETFTPDMELQVCIDIEHTFVGDLNISLIGSDGITEAFLTMREGGGGDNFSGTCFTTSATLPITSGVPPFTGIYKPKDSFSLFQGPSINGIWTLKVADLANGDQGKLESWSLTVNQADLDRNPTNEIQQLNINGEKLSISGGNLVEITNLPKLGIGITNPASSLHIRDTSKAALILQTSANNNPMGLAFRRQSANYEWSINRVANSQLVFSGGNNSELDSLNEVLRLSAAGRLGIGGVNPSNALDVDGKIRMREGAVDGYIPVGNSNGVMTWTNPDAVNIWQRSGNDIYYTQGRIAVGTATSGALIDAENVNNYGNLLRLKDSNGNPRLTVRNGGGIIVADSSRTALNIKLLNNTADNGISFQKTGTNYVWSIYRSSSLDAGDLVFASGESSNILNLSERMRIKGQTGRVGIGTNLPSYDLDVLGSESTYIAQIENTLNSTTADCLRLQLNVATNPDPLNRYIVFVNASSFIGAISGDGTGGVDYATASDRRLKQNIETYNKGLETVMAIRPAIYQMKSAPDKECIGFIAQEQYEVLPNVVNGTPDNPIEEPMMVDYGKLTPALLGAIQDQQAMIEAQQEQINQLIEEVNLLKA